MVTYDYNRAPKAKTARYSPATPYSESLEAIQEQFVGAVGSVVANYINLLNRRTKRTGSWTYGSPVGRGANMYSIVVYNEMQSSPGAINVYFKFGDIIDIVASTDEGQKLLAEKSGLDRSASGVGLEIGDGWKKLTASYLSDEG